MTRRMIIAALALGGVGLATYLAMYKLGYIGTLNCAIGSCETVNTSRWATFFGIPVAAWGLGFYLVALTVAFMSVQERYADSRKMAVALAVLTGWGTVFSGWLTYLELFVIHAICIWCVTSACIVLLMFLVSLADLREFSAEPA